MIRLSHLIALAIMALLLQSGPVSAAILIKGVTVIDGTGRPARTGQTVLIDADRITAIRDHVIGAPAGVTVIDGRGKFLIPGLIDTHIHLAGGRTASSAAATDRSVTMNLELGRHMLHGFLYSGVTSVVDVGNYDKFIFAMRAAERSGQMVSPRIFAAGYVITRPNGYGGSGGAATVNTFEQGTQALDRLFAQKPDIVKFILAPHGVGGGAELPVFEPALLHRLIMYANEHGFRTTIHAVEGPSRRIAVEAGIDGFAHPAHMSESDDRLATLIATRGIPVSTTLVVLHNMFQIVDDPSFFDESLFRAILTDKDIALHRDFDRKRYQSAGLDAWGRQEFAYATADLHKLYAAGATIALGTDRTVGAMVHQELELIVGLGIPPLQAPRIATLNGAIYLHVADRMGSVEEGKLADLVLLDADPTQDIRNARTISAVILCGKVVDRTQLDLPINHRAVSKW